MALIFSTFLWLWSPSCSAPVVSREKMENPTVPEGQLHRVTTPQQTSENREEPRRTLGETPAEASKHPPVRDAETTILINLRFGGGPGRGKIEGKLSKTLFFLGDSMTTIGCTRRGSYSAKGRVSAF